MKGVTVKTLDNGAQVMWAVPTGGFGHAADEQPLPHIRYKGRSLTPRYGGEESLIEASYDSLPLPCFYLIDGWPLSQKVFSLFRRRANIYWRNLFATVCRSDNKFLFSQQLNYKEIDNGFHGVCPLVEHFRRIEIFSNVIMVRDEVKFKSSLRIDRFVLTHYPVVNNCFMRLDAQFDGNKIYNVKCSSSTGFFELGAYEPSLKFVAKGQLVESCYRLEVVDVI